MACKRKMVEELGEGELLLPNLVNEALSANDRAKYLMTLLQMAKDHADYPDLASPDLKQERLACGITESNFDSVIERSQGKRPGCIAFPRRVRFTTISWKTLGECWFPFRSATRFRCRWQLACVMVRAAAREAGLRGALPGRGPDHRAFHCLDHVVQQNEHDGLHLLIMDLHKELNRLQQQIATESIDGACVYGVHEGDRPLIRAFMAGLNRTRELKFDHPGLGTTATRTGDKLVIQNDIGMTEAHVLVVHVEREQVTLTYTDIHIARLVFFQNLFDCFEVRRDDSLSKRASGLREEMYHLCQEPTRPRTGRTWRPTCPSSARDWCS